MGSINKLPSKLSELGDVTINEQNLAGNEILVYDNNTGDFVQKLVNLIPVLDIEAAQDIDALTIVNIDPIGKVRKIDNYNYMPGIVLNAVQKGETAKVALFPCIVTVTEDLSGKIGKGVFCDANGKLVFDYNFYIVGVIISANQIYLKEVKIFQ